MNSHRISVPSWVPDFDFIEDIARILNISSADLRARLCPVEATHARDFRDWLIRRALTDAALAEIRQSILEPGRTDLGAIAYRFDRLLGIISTPPQSELPARIPNTAQPSC